MEKLSAVEILYNLAIVGNEKTCSIDKAKRERERELCKEDALDSLTCEGCPEGISQKHFSNDCYHFDDNCTDCWQQKVDEHKEWEEEYDD